MEDKYIKYKEEFLETEKSLRSKSTLLGLVKFVFLIVFCLFLWRGIQEGYKTFTILGMGITFLVSLPAWICHWSVTEKINECKKKIEIVGQYLDRLQGNWSNFSEKGSNNIDYQHAYTFDLDVFGDKSLFQFLNVAGTAQGKEQLSRDLSCANYSYKEIMLRQSAVEELAQMKHDKLCFEMQYSAAKANESDKLEELVDILTGSRRFLNKEWIRIIFKLFPIFTVVSLIVALIAKLQGTIIIALVFVCIQILIWLCFSLKTYNFLRSVDSAQHALEEYNVLFSLISELPFESVLLKEFQKQLGGDVAGKAFKQLDGIVQMISMRSNVILYVLFNALFMWDINCSLRLEKWKKNYSAQINPWLKILGDFEALLSLAVINRTVKGISYPFFLQEDRKEVEVKQIGHPLIENSTRICNDYKLENNINVISGSNMSGKTTFLRTIGINIVLAKAGAAVCAESMELTDMEVMTSMRIVDDLHEGVSTFYAELKRIKAIVEASKKSKRILFLIDEIFRGTNSQDRTEGAKAVMAQLAMHGASGFMTTHDLKLCESTEHAHIKNSHFTEQYLDGELVFDYKIRDGIAKTTNGRYLMQMLGLI